MRARNALLGLTLALVTATVVARPLPATLPAQIAADAAGHRFSGTVLVQADGSPPVLHITGLADLAHGVPHAADTRYRVASITKLFTAVLVLQLHDERRLALDAPIARYLPGYTGPGATRVQVRHLLNHTSGLDNFDTVKTAAEALERGIPVYQLPHTSDALLRDFASGALVHEPGTTFDYNNGDYVVLGKIIEAIEGAPFETVLRRRVLDPLALRDTGMLRQEMVVPRLASTYFARTPGGPLTPDLPMYPENWYAAGAMYSTAADLATFARALFAGTLLRPDSLAALQAPGLDDYGFGVWSYTMKAGGRAHRVVKRPGRIMGAQAMLMRLPDSATTIVLLANTDTVDLDEFAARIARMLLAPARQAPADGRRAQARRRAPTASTPGTCGP